MRVVHHLLELFEAVELPGIENRMLSGIRFRILPENSFVPDLDGLAPEEQGRADVVQVHEEGGAHQLEGLGDPFRVVDHLVNIR